MVLVRRGTATAGLLLGLGVGLWGCLASASTVGLPARAENVALERCLRRAVLVRSSAVRIPRVTTTKAAPLDGDGFAFVASLLRGRWAFYSSGRLGGRPEI